MPLKRHENVLVFSGKQPTYNPQKTEGELYSRSQSSPGETTFDQSVSGWITKSDGGRFPTSVIEIPNTEKGLHPTQKPVGLYEWIVKTYSNPGDVVLDPCIGSGTTGKACVATGRSFIGIEKERKYFDIASEGVGTAVPKVQQERMF